MTTQAPKTLILPFQCVEPDEAIYLVASRLGLVRVNSAEIFRAAQKIHEVGWGTALSHSELHELMISIEPARRSDATRYFSEIGILREVHADFGRFSGIWLVHDEGLTLGALAEDLAYLTGLPCECATETEPIVDNEFVVVYTPKFDKALIRKTQQHVKGLSNTPVLSSYLAARTLVIDGLYLPAAHTPCHFCQASDSAVNRRHGSNFPPSWVVAFGALTSKPPIAGFEYPVMPSDHDFCRAILRNRIRELVGPHHQAISARSLLEACQFSLDGFQMQRETPTSSMECEFCHTTT